jgi:hypothetical protein
MARFGATSNTPDEILETIRKLDFLRNNKVNQWELSAINPNRQKFLANLDAELQIKESKGL